MISKYRGPIIIGLIILLTSSAAAFRTFKNPSTQSMLETKQGSETCVANSLGCSNADSQPSETISQSPMPEIGSVPQTSAGTQNTEKNIQENTQTNIAATSSTSSADTNTASGTAACTMEAKMCPDGSYVGRTGPDCQFAPCPDAR